MSDRFELASSSTDYPEQLRYSVDPPNVLFGIGDPSRLKPGLGIVGARKATPYGLACARRFGRWAASAGYVVYSGGAIGCDQAAHRAALEVNGETVAVMGCGADVVYPRGSGQLLARIASAGAVVSEYPWGTTPQRWTFRMRNRIIAGLSGALLVVEAGLGSGTFSTAEYALDSGRDVLAVPGSIYAPECAGSNRLIRQGATPITDTDELRCALESVLGPPRATCEYDWTPGTGHSLDDPVLSAVCANPSRPDDLARDLGLDIISVTRGLGRFEAMGLVTRYRDGRWGPAG